MAEYLVTRTGLHHRAEIHDDDALTLPAGEFMRVAVHRARVHAADLQYLRDPVVHVRLRGEPVFEQRLADGPPDGHSRVQRTVRVLEGVLHLRTYRAQFALGELEQVMSLEQHLAAGLALQSQHGLPERGLA